MGNCINSKNSHAKANLKTFNDKFGIIIKNYSMFLGGKNSNLDEPTIESPVRLRISEQDVEHYLDIDQVIIGRGEFGVVRVAKQRNSPSHVFALKTLEKAHLKNFINSIYREVILLNSCDHPNIVRFYEMFECEEKVHFQLEYCTGENLGDLLKKVYYFKESQLKLIFRQILLAIHHMHIRGISHRDIKPDNFIFKMKKDFTSLKLLDFGFAKRFFGKNGKTRMYKLVGTPAFVAPEVLLGDYDEKCDIWSAGILLYQMSCGNFPYNFDQDLPSLYKQIIRSDIDYKKNFKGLKLSKDFFSLLQGLLTSNEKSRISILQALSHPWFDSEIPPSLEIFQKRQLIENFSKFKNYTFFQKNVFKVYVKFLSKFEIKNSTTLFHIIDRDLDGIISFPELKYFLVQHEMFASNKACIKDIESLHQTDNHHIFYTEFLAATIDKSIILIDSNLQRLYQSLKLKNHECLSFKSIENIYILAGYSFKRSQFDEFLQKFGVRPKSNDGIDFEEFKVLMNIDIKCVVSAEEEINMSIQNKINSKNFKDHWATKDNSTSESK